MAEAVFSEWSALAPTLRAGIISRSTQAARALNSRFQFLVEGTLEARVSPGGALDGMPYVAKDVFDLPGRSPGLGLNERPADTLPKRPAEILSRLDAAGAARIGLARMTAIAYEPSGVHTALNPWNTEMVPGGSSSGSAVAVACGAAVLALGTDTGGSVRIPAHCCGITGWKPTPGMVPDAGMANLAPSLDTIGMMARGAADIAAVVAALGLTADTELMDEPSVGVAGDLMAGADGSVRTACEAGIDALAGIGCRIDRVEADGPVSEAGRATLNVLQGEAARLHPVSLVDHSPDKLLARRLAAGKAVDDAMLAAELADQPSAQRDFLDAVFGSAEWLVLPTMPIRTPAVAEADPASESFSARALYAMSAYTRFANYLGLPAISAPTGFDDRGMPVGLQIAGRPGTDLALLRLATRLQAATEWHLAVPCEAADILAKAQKDHS